MIFLRLSAQNFSMPFKTSYSILESTKTAMNIRTNNVFVFKPRKSKVVACFGFEFERCNWKFSSSKVRRFAIQWAFNDQIYAVL